MLLLTATPCQHQKGSIVVTGFCWCHYMVLFNFLKSREGRGWHGALYYTSPIVPPSGIGEREGNYSRQRKGSSETSNGADQSQMQESREEFSLPPCQIRGLDVGFLSGCKGGAHLATSPSHHTWGQPLPSSFATVSSHLPGHPISSFIVIFTIIFKCHHTRPILLLQY